MAMLAMLALSGVEGILALQAAPDEAAVRALVEKLGVDDVEARDRAQDELLALDERVLPLLEKLRPAASAEARIRLDQIVEDLGSFPATVVALAAPRTSREALQKLEADVATGKRGRSRAVRILNLLLRDESAAQDVRASLIQIADRQRLAEAWPGIVAAVLADESTNYAGLQALRRSGANPAAGEAILAGVPSVRGANRLVPLIEAAVALKAPPEAVDRAVRRILEGEPDSLTQNILMNAIGTGKIPVSLRTMVEWWESSRSRRSAYASDVRNALLAGRPDGSEERILPWAVGEDLQDAALAVEYVARHKIERGAPFLARALERQTRERAADELPSAYRGLTSGARFVSAETQSLAFRIVQVLRGMEPEKRAGTWLDGAAGAPPRAATLAMIGALELKGLAASAARLLEDGEEEVRRREAARALGALKWEDGVPALEGRMKDPSRAVRRAALQAIVRIRGARATGRLLETLRSPDPDDQAAAVELMAWADVDEALGELTKPERAGAYMSRYALATMILRHGEPVLHRVMARLGERFSATELQDFVKLLYAARAGR